MMDHCEERRHHTAHWADCQTNIVTYIRDTLGLSFSQDEVNHAIGLIEVNAFEVKLGPETSGKDTPELGAVLQLEPETKVHPKVRNHGEGPY